MICTVSQNYLVVNSRYKFLVKYTKGKSAKFHRSGIKITMMN